MTTHNGTGPAENVDTQSLLLVVVGAHLRAEMNDRPLADRLVQTISAWQERMQSVANEGGGKCEPLRAVICTDLWYLNSHDLLARPAIALGEPSVNAATAYLSNKLPTAFMIESKLRVHLDPEFIDPQVCIWGVDHNATAAGVDVFVERYLDQFMQEAAGIRR